MGGKAFKNIVVRPIKKEQIDKTFRYFKKISQLPNNAFYLGSTGKNDQSGDIDVAVCITSLGCSVSEFHQRLTNKLGIDRVFFNPGYAIGSYAVPVEGNETLGELVQLDVMFTTSPTWVKFSFFSPSSKQSKYKGVIRTLLLRATTASINVPGIDLFKYDSSGQLIVRIGRTFDMINGVKRIIQVRNQRKDKKGFLKTLTTITTNELADKYPDMYVSSVNTITDPEQALFLLFGRYLSPTDVETAEQIIQLIKQFDLNRQLFIKQYIIDACSKRDFLTNSEIENLFD